MRTVAATIMAIATLYFIVWKLMMLAAQAPPELEDRRHPPSTIGAPSPIPLPNR